jgi:hypothetical protein
VIRWSSAAVLLFVFIATASGEIEVLSSNDNGIILKLTIPPVEIDDEGFPRYEGCGFMESGGSKLPMTRLMIGVPPQSDLKLSLLDWSEMRRPISKAMRWPARIFPGKPAEIVTDGYIRSQRVAILELHPVQYDRTARSLRIHGEMTVKVDFVRTYGAPPIRSSYGREPEPFESLFKRRMLNYDRARLWRKAPLRRVPSPAPPIGRGERIKIYIEKTGVYRLTARELEERWGVDLSGVDPRTFRLTCKGEELPIYVKGESDGSFDPDDYVEFLGVNPNHIYSRYNIYWLSYGAGRGLRVSALDGEPIDMTATHVTSFRSKIRFEEDHVHSILNHLPPDQVSPEDPFDWFNRLDHWFWTGIKNGGDKNEVELPFKLFDVAKSFSRPKFTITLQGGTPTEHDILVSVNGIRIDRAQFPKQEIVTLSRTLPANSFIDATEGDNVITCVKIDTTKESNTTIYPYHVYINRFYVEYMRLYKAVRDALDFSSPEEKEVDRGELLEYSIQDFLADDVDVFIHDGTRLLTIISNPSVDRVKLDEEERERFRRILDVEGLERAPEYAYTVRFQHRYKGPIRFYAVSSRGALKPSLVELKEGRDLLSPSNSADYILITHPAFMRAAQRLVEWRMTSQGGGFRAMAVDVTDIYDQFNHGIVNPRAIKDFLKYAYENWASPKLTYVSILGDATVDFHGVTEKLYDKPPELSGYIPTYFIWTDYGETSTDHWFATLSGSDALPDVYLGRIPVETPEQADEVVDKIIRYERNSPNGEWRRRIISIADDSTTNTGDLVFKQSMSEIDRDYIPPGYENVKLFLDDIREDIESHPSEYGGKFIGDVAKAMIVDALDEGALLAQYAGHAGRFVWAHEIIFDRFGVEALAPNERIPFMLVYSCYNGYFDAAGQDSMAELLLRKPDAGIIGMFSATRQTYGSANDSLSKIVLDEIFRRGKRRIGRISFDSKIELLLRDGLGQLEVMMQYTLFGDPATPLPLPDYEIETKLDRYSFSPGDTIKVLPGKLIGNGGRDPSRFSGRLIARVKIEGKTITSSSAAVSGGRYPEIKITLPNSLDPSHAILDLYAESSSEVAVGGTKITIGLPIIRDITDRIVGDKIQISCSVYGSSPVEKVLLFWGSLGMSSEQSLEMIRKGDRLFFGEIDLPSPGEGVSYEIQVITSGGTTTSPKRRVEVPSPPNLSVVVPPFPNRPLIYFDGTTLVAEIQWEGGRPNSPVDAALFEGNPDRDRDGEVDPDVKEIARARVQTTAWVRRDPRKRETPSVQMLTFEKDPLNVNWLAKVVFKADLPPGEGFFFVWIDPDDRIKEANEPDNLKGVILRLETFNLDGSGELDDPRARFHLSVPREAVEGKTLSIKLKDISPGEGQPGLEGLPLAGGMKAMEISGGAERFKSPLTLRLSFSYEELARQIRRKMGVNYTEPLLQQAIKEFIQESSLYLWLPEVSGWRRIGSKVELDGSGELKLKSAVILVTSENEGDGGMLESGSWASDKAPLSDWVLIFTHGNMRLIRLGDDVEDLGTSIGSFQNIGLHLKVQNDPKEPFRAGDSIYFSTLRSSSGEVMLSGSRTRNYGDGIAKILSIAPDAPDDVWTLIFLDEENFTVVGVEKGLVRSAGKAVIGKVGEEFRPAGLGISLRVDPGATTFRKGDTIKIVVHKVGVMEAEIDRPGIYAIMRSHDETPPEITVAVSGQDFADGDYVPREPNFAISLRDDGGVDPESVKLTLVRNLIERIEVKEDEVVISPSQSGVVTVNYTPKLDPAKYELMIECSDLDGHTAEKRVEFVVSKNTAMSDVMSYPNPFSDETEITCVLSSEVDAVSFSVYTLSGRLIWRRKLTGAIGFVQVNWDGTDQDGRQVANGVYYCKVTAKRDGESLSKVIKLMRLR